MSPRLHPYQVTGAEWLSSPNLPKRGLLWPVGLGKTLPSLQVLDDFYSTCRATRPLVLAPILATSTTWPGELRKWFPALPYRVIWQEVNDLRRRYNRARKEGMSTRTLLREARKTLLQFDGVTLCNYDNLRFLAQLFGKAWPYDLVIMDESDRLKNASAGRTRAAIQVGRLADRVIELTGTFAPRSLEDCWSQAKILDDGQRLGRSLTEFRTRWFTPHPRGFGWIQKPGAAEEVSLILADLYMSLRAEDYLDLPERIDNVLEVELPQGVRAQYAKLEREAFLELQETSIDAPNAGVLVGKLQQLASGALYLEGGGWTHLHDAKMDALDSVLGQCGGEPVLVVYGYRSELERLQVRYPSAELLTAENGADVVTRWNAGQIPLLLSYPTDSLNLQPGGRHMVWFHPPWDLRQYVQMCGRLHRQGQQRRTFFHHLVARGTVDEDVMAALARKARVQETLLAGVRARVASV